MDGTLYINACSAKKDILVAIKVKYAPNTYELKNSNNKQYVRIHLYFVTLLYIL
jgi:hypothetical protein